MMNEPAGERRLFADRKWIVDVAILTLLVVGIYAGRLTTLHLRGEETRRAEVAVEMLRSGDWIVPRQQGEFYHSRPPLGNWLIAIAGAARGGVDVVAARLPSVIAILLTTLVIYFYSTQYLSRAASFVAAVAFATMAQVMDIGWTAETEAVFTLLLASSLMVWHFGYSKGISPWIFWTAGYSLAALAALAKGPQGPVYFGAPVVAFLLWRRDWKTLFSAAHVVGGLSFVGIVGAWQIPYLLEAGPRNAYGVWFKLATNNFHSTTNYSRLIKHLLTFPLEVFGCMMPWSIGLIPLATKSFWRERVDLRGLSQFHLLAAAVTFPSIWFAADAVPRYFMPLYPLLAVMIGAACEFATDPKRTGWLAHWWPMTLRGSAVASVGLAAAVVAIALQPWGVLVRLQQPPAFVSLFCLVCLAAAAILLSLHRRARANEIRLAVTCIGCVLGLTFTGFMLNTRVNVQIDAAANVAVARDTMIGNAPLTSVGPLPHQFVFHFDRHIPMIKPADAAENPELVGPIFAVWNLLPEEEIPFEYEVIGEVQIDRFREGRDHQDEEVLVTVCRKLSDSPTQTAILPAIIDARK
ncbi:ArnT family glycosyltransferase [Stratiformator vulcanicus]|uniref:Undecaprenyl phosphate-alpha-4-amino-4-deoxy-L-arabinose arabinosyl transferase n=1 Tax=Stratiformator vulcanicus TaxID=2527980 RepID=A0A517QZX4_9PLAN|nr:glycosyltransferase family 39 protein [Stratiformator vulcanicus]QDT37143.1 Undecaprenyl phosphate-alpha-4-amino-4-deoxy-L-arabinose arabinosyl transferase [Stratiformator vulcanicus]